MGIYVAQETVKLLIHAGRPVRNAQVLVLGVAFKENVPDVRDTRVKELVQELQSFSCYVEVCDPVVLESDRKRIPAPFVDDPFHTRRGHYDAVVLAVPHKAFREYTYSEYLTLMSALAQGVFVDVKGVYLSDARADTSGKVLYWNLSAGIPAAPANLRGIERREVSFPT